MHNYQSWPWLEEMSPSTYSGDINWPKLSIVMPTLNQGEYIEEAIRSVICQNYPNLQFVIIDGGSTDATVEVIKKYESDIYYWISEPDLGQSDAINKGFAKCDGEVFNWINSDDFYEKESFLKLATHFLDDDVDIICGLEYGFRDYNARTISKGSTIHHDLENTILSGHIDQPATFWRRSVFESLGAISIDLHYAMDSEMWLRYLLKYGQSRIKKVPDVLVNFRYHLFSKTVSGKDRMNQEYFSLMHSIFYFINRTDEILAVVKELYDRPRIREWSICDGLDIAKMRYAAVNLLLNHLIIVSDFRPFTEQQIFDAITESNNAFDSSEICRKLSIYEATLYNWRRKFAGLSAQEILAIKQRETEDPSVSILRSELRRMQN
jgi:glycosyltransferase involved in cell wall biosynthesis